MFGIEVIGYEVEMFVIFLEFGIGVFVIYGDDGIGIVCFIFFWIKDYVFVSGFYDFVDVIKNGLVGWEFFIGIVVVLLG